MQAELDEVFGNVEYLPGFVLLSFIHMLLSSYSIIWDANAFSFQFFYNYNCIINYLNFF